jgi:hypothetical protein
MTDLQRQALATVPLSAATVESFYDGSHSGTEKQCLRALCKSHERLRAELEGAELLLKEDEERRKSALALILRYGGIDGSHHKQWSLDQIVRTLTGDKYAEWVASYNAGEEGLNTYQWDEGIAP